MVRESRRSRALDRRLSSPPESGDAALSIRGLTKVYQSGLTAVSGFDLEVRRGSFFGLLGPNGAGKTTLIGAICNLVIPTAGEIRVFGHPHGTREARRLIGLAEQDVNLDRFLNISEILIYHAGYHGMGRAEARRRARELLDLFRLSDKARHRAHELSGGMQRRLMFARALMHAPDLLILDEPTAGVDVELRTELWDYIRGLHADGVTVLLTTHYLEEAEELCDDIALIRGGQIVARDTADRLRAGFGVENIASVYRQVMAGPSERCRAVT